MQRDVKNLLGNLGFPNTAGAEDGHAALALLNSQDYQFVVTDWNMPVMTGIELLKAFVNVESYTDKQLAWKVGLHLTFVLSGVLFAFMDRLTAGKPNGH